MKIIPVKQGTPEWHEFRKDKIGASLASVIMGVCPWKTPLQLYNEMKGIIDQAPTSAFMERGIEMEAQARSQFEYLKGKTFPSIVVQDDHLPWMIASLDGWNEEEKCLVEIKCPGMKAHQIALRGQVPDHYYPQLQHQMY